MPSLFSPFYVLRTFLKFISQFALSLLNYISLASKTPTKCIIWIVFSLWKLYWFFLKSVWSFFQHALFLNITVKSRILKPYKHVYHISHLIIPIVPVGLILLIVSTSFTQGALLLLHSKITFVRLSLVLLKAKL